MSSRTRRRSFSLSRWSIVATTSSCSWAAALFTTSAPEPSRKTTAWRTASSSGWTPSSAGMTGNTAAPSGTSSATGHRGDDAQLVAVLHRRAEAVEIAYVLVIEVHVQERLHLAAVEELCRKGRVFLTQVVERLPHVGTVHFDNRLTLRVLAKRRGNVDLDRHWFPQTNWGSRTSGSKASSDGLIVTGSSSSPAT